MQSPRKQRSPSKKSPQKTKSGFSAAQNRSIADNYELESLTRRQALEQSMNELLSTLSRRLEAEFQKIPSAIYDMKMSTFVDQYDMDVRKAMESIVRNQIAVEEAENQKDVSKLQAAVAQSAKKRKRNEGQTSVPPSPAMPSAKRHAPFHQNQNQNQNPFTNKASHKTPRAKARVPPSPQLNPLLPPTPALGTSSTFGERSRRPRRNESMQAYSLNGSPLGVITSNVNTTAEPASGVPTGEFTFRVMLESLANGLKQELENTNMGPQERQRLESRLLQLVQGLGT